MGRRFDLDLVMNKGNATCSTACCPILSFPTDALFELPVCYVGLQLVRTQPSSSSYGNFIDIIVRCVSY